MLNEIQIKSVITEIQKATNAKTEKNCEEHIKRAIFALDKSIQKEIPVEIISPANYTLREQKDLFISSGCGWIDFATGGGLRREELMIVGGEFHSGKTHIMSYIGAQYLAEGLTVLHFNGEDILDDIINIYKNSILQITSDSNLEGLYFVNAMDAGLFNFDIVTNAILKQPSDMVIIDHMDIMDSSGKEQDWLAVSKLARELKFLAKKYNNIIIAGSQAIDGRLFRGNNSKSMHPDIIWYIEELVEGLVNLTVRKGRGRKIKNKKLSLNVDYETMQINSEMVQT